jgi:GNAT superfamily N-acetyltransferase
VDVREFRTFAPCGYGNTNACAKQRMSQPFICHLRESDVPLALRLSTQSGWNQIHADWRRLISLWPQSCYAIWDADRLVATGTLAIFDRQSGWVGMILVDASRRGQGLGSAMMSHILRVADDSGITHLGLDATDLGRPVYVKQGFKEQCEIVRWIGETRRSIKPATRSATTSDWSSIMRLDREATCVDRGYLLRHLAAEAGVEVHAISDAPAINGFGLCRAGRTSAHIGPIIAQHPDAVFMLFEGLLDAVHSAGASQVIVDVPMASSLSLYLPSCGFRIARHLFRMSRPRHAALLCPALLTGPLVAAATGFEVG